ncbi:MAG: hypothetical protein QM535_16430 [Limnohabitans sp.]|nr:hypothetical protein [Limnohabitans sp.]
MKRYDLSDAYSTEEVVVYNSVATLVFKVVFSLLFFICTIYIFQKDGNWIFGIIFLVLSLIFGRDTFVYFTNINKVQLTINVKGVQYKDNELVEWRFVKNERIKRKRSGKTNISSLVYYIENQDKIIELNLENVSISEEDLINLFAFFRDKSKGGI